MIATVKPQFYRLCASQVHRASSDVVPKHAWFSFVNTMSKAWHPGYVQTGRGLLRELQPAAGTHMLGHRYPEAYPLIVIGSAPDIARFFLQNAAGLIKAPPPDEEVPRYDIYMSVGSWPMGRGRQELVIFHTVFAQVFAGLTRVVPISNVVRGGIHGAMTEDFVSAFAQPFMENPPSFSNATDSAARSAVESGLGVSAGADGVSTFRQNSNPSGTSVSSQDELLYVQFSLINEAGAVCLGPEVRLHAVPRALSGKLPIHASVAPPPTRAAPGARDWAGNGYQWNAPRPSKPPAQSGVRPWVPAAVPLRTR